MTVLEYANRHGITRQEVYKLIAERTLNCVKLSDGTYRIGEYEGIPIEPILKSPENIADGQAVGSVYPVPTSQPQPVYYPPPTRDPALAEILNLMRMQTARPIDTQPQPIPIQAAGGNGQGVQVICKLIEVFGKPIADLVTEGMQKPSALEQLAGALELQEQFKHSEPLPERTNFFEAIGQLARGFMNANAEAIPYIRETDSPDRGGVQHPNMPSGGGNPWGPEGDPGGQEDIEQPDPPVS